jgi:hypothetical protein
VPTLSNPVVLAVKAALAVALSLGLVKLAGLQDELSASFAALACTTPVVVTGVRRGLEQVAASAIGGALTSLLLLLLPRHPATLGLAMAATILLTFTFGLAAEYLVAGFTVLYVYLIPAATPGLALEERMLSLVVGVAAATLVNTVVSASFYRRIFTRRVGLVHEAVAKACETLAACAREPADRERAPLAFDGVFPLLWSLGSDLSDARREQRLRPGAGSDVAAFHDEVRALARLAHLGKELGLHVESSPALAAALAGPLEALAQEVRGQAVATSPEGGAEWVGAYRRAVEAAREAHRAGRAAGRERRVGSGGSGAAGQ